MADESAIQAAVQPPPGRTLRAHYRHPSELVLAYPPPYVPRLLPLSFHRHDVGEEFRLFLRLLFGSDALTITSRDIHAGTKSWPSRMWPWILVV